MQRFGWPRVLLALVAASAVALAPSCASSEVEPVPAGDLANLDFKLKDMNGQVIDLAAYRGKPIILNFWATWCGPCKAEIPALIELTDRYKAQNLTVLGVSVDDSPDDLKQFAAEYKMNYPVLVGLGQDAFQEKYEAAIAIPITWFIRADGTILKKHQGPASKAWLETQVKALIAPAQAKAEAH